MEFIAALFLGLIALPAALGWLGMAGLIAFIVLLLLFDGWEAPGVAGLFIVATCAILWYLGIANVALWVLHNPGWSATYFVGWFVVGALWAAYKFDRFGADEAARYLQDKARNPGFYMETVVDPSGATYPQDPSRPGQAPRQKTIEIPRTKSVPDPAGGMNDNGTPKTIEVPVLIVDKANYIPIALQNKHKLTNWIVLWPCSMVKYVFGEMFQRIVNFIIKHFGKFYDALAARHFADLK